MSDDKPLDGVPEMPEAAKGAALARGALNTLSGAIPLYEATIGGKHCVVEYEPDTDLRDSEQVPLQEVGGVEAFISTKRQSQTSDVIAT